MKVAKTVRKVDELGRIVLPHDLRRALGIGAQCQFEVQVQAGKIILKKCEQANFTFEPDNITKYTGQKLSAVAINDMVALID